MCRTLALCVVVAGIGCRQGSKAEPEQPAENAPESAADDFTCVADGLKLGEYDDDVPRHTCDSSTDECEKLCAKDDGRACAEVAFVLERDESTKPRATELFRKACRLGSHNACANYGAHLHHDATDDARRQCSARLFDMVCKYGEPFSCGMRALARHRGIGVPEDGDAGVSLAERYCKEMGFFPCFALGLIHEADGELDKAAAAFSRACETEYEDGCAEAERLRARAADAGAVEPPAPPT